MFKAAIHIGKKNLLRVSVFLLICLYPNFLFAQSTQTLATQLADGLTDKTNRIPQNLSYVQTNKGVFEKGEDIWFKVYEVDAKFFEPSNLSEILYVQVVSAKNNEVAWQEKYTISDGFAEGHIPINDSLEIGTYYIIASSAFSTNKNINSFSGVRKIEIIDNIRSFVNSIQKLSNSQEFESLQLFPEGGQLVNKLPCRVAFKALDKKGMPYDFQGVVYEDKEKLVEIRSKHAGMGSFIFIPKKGKLYEVQIEKNGTLHKIPIKGIFNNGVALSLSQQNEENASFRIYRSELLEKEKLYLRIQMRGIVYGIATINPGQVSKVAMPLEMLPRGIAECTIFNERLEPIAERLLFVNDAKKLSIECTLSPSKQEGFYNKREKITAKIRVTDAHGKPIIGNFGISVFEQIFENVNDSKNIASHFYLSTQIKGRIHNPDYYFNQKNKDRLANLDLLLLTQGWRKYTWKEENLNQLREDTLSLLTNGLVGEAKQVKKKKNGVENLPTIVSFNPNENEMGAFIDVYEDGSFIIPSKELQRNKDGYAYFKYFAADDLKYKFDLSNPFSSINSIKNIDSLLYPIQTIEGEKLPDLSIRSSFDVIKLDDIVVKAKSKVMIRDRYLSKLDSIAKLAYTTDYVCKHNILNCKIHVLDKENRKPVEGEIYMKLLVWTDRGFEEGTDLSRGFINPPLPPYHYPDFTDEFLLDAYQIFRMPGIYPKKEFYQPDYEKYEDPGTDHRNALFWNPFVITDTKGEAEISFFCSDIYSKFNLVIEGIGYEGLIGTKELEFGVSE